MQNNIRENEERAKSIKILIARWIVKQETAEKAALLLLKNPHIKLIRPLKFREKL